MVTNYKKETIDSYNQNTKEFSSKYKYFMNLDKRDEFQDFIDLIKWDKVLDLGCWPWHHSVYFKEKWFNVTSIDLSKWIINLCKEKWLNAQIMDIENLELEDNSFDWIRAATSLLHIPKSNIENVIKKLTQILKDDWILHVSVKEGTWERFVEDRSWWKKRFFAFWEENELKNIFNKYFLLLKTQKAQEKETTYLKAFFRKK